MVEAPASNPEAITIAGNEWVFSERNKWLNPRVYKQEFQDLSQTTETVQRLVYKTLTTYIQEGWNFASVLGSDSGFAIVFTNPLKTAVLQQCPSPDFLRPEVSGIHPQANIWMLKTEPINEVLMVGANLYAYNARGSYNHFEFEGQTGLFIKRPRIFTFYQSGVGAIIANLYPLGSIIGRVEAEIEKEAQTFNSKLQPLQEQRSYLLAMKSSNPQPLFN